MALEIVYFVLQSSKIIITIIPNYATNVYKYLFIPFRDFKVFFVILNWFM